MESEELLRCRGIHGHFKAVVRKYSGGLRNLLLQVIFVIADFSVRYSKGKNLVWDYSPASLQSGRRLIASEGMLESFIKLAQAPDRSIESFAKRWGVLGICEHGLKPTVLETHPGEKTMASA